MIMMMILMKQATELMDSEFNTPAKKAITCKEKREYTKHEIL